jgi:hypothetical protein
MKKVFLLPLFAMAVFASGAWAAGDYCNCGECVGSKSEGWACNSGGCYKKADQEGEVCGQYCPEVETCPAGTIPPKVVENGGYPPSGSITYYCRWEKSCWSITGSTASCEKDGYLYTDVPPGGRSSSVDDGKQCEGGTWTGKGKTDNPDRTVGEFGFCNYGPCEPEPGNDYGCLEGGGCFELLSQEKKDDCGSNWLATESQCPLASLPPAKQTAILSTPKAQGLTVLSSGKVLHILSVRDAQVSLFDLSGSLVLSGNVKAGNSEFSLKTLKQGVYYAKVQSGSQTQTVKVMLK